MHQPREPCEMYPYFSPKLCNLPCELLYLRLKTAPDDGVDRGTKRPLDVDFQKTKKKTRKIKFSCRNRDMGTKIWGKAASENEHRDAERKVPQWCELFSQYSSGTCSWTRTRRYGAPRIKNTANAKETNLVDVLYTMKRLL